MRFILPILFLAACTAIPTRSATDELVCDENVTRYDVEDPAIFQQVDPTFGLSAAEMENVVWGESVGTLTPTGASPVGVAMLFGIQGTVEVHDFEPAGCGTMAWKAPLFVVMSTDEGTAPYTVDDIWDVDGEATSLTEATASGMKPAADFDGSLTVVGTVSFTATRSGNAWTGEIVDDSGVIATYSTTHVAE